MNDIKAFRLYLRELWKKTWRTVFTLPLVQWVVAALAAFTIWLIYVSCRVRIKNKDLFLKFVGKPVIFAFWHGRSMMLSPVTVWFKFSGYAVTSQHRDGRLMAKIQRMFGLRAILGSTGRKGAVSVLRQGVRLLREGHLLCLSPDGPKGPRMRIHDGALYFAKMTGAPIIPVCFSCSRPWFQRRWDKYLIAIPFSKIAIEAGQPFYIGINDDMEDARVRLENIMIEQLQKLDASFGLPKIEPGEKQN
ncbi:MAG: lysophospholipid acyltransferase family protein [Alphaproteobacteria bacterium]|nr:lysophospholipid acyltransferase family protein [Alphaproteobacteria bacterium]